MSPTIEKQPDTSLNNAIAKLEELKASVASCTLCELCTERTQTVFSDGSPTARILIIGEGPGEKEDLTGTPFVGRSGQLLTQCIEAAGLNRKNDTYICNVVKCRPPNNRAPKPVERTACKPYLNEQIALVKPDMILLAGATALKGVLGISSGITKLRGQWMPTDYIGKFGQKIHAMAIFHPSYLLRNPTDKPGSPKDLMRQDMTEVRRVWDNLNAGQPYAEAFNPPA